MKQLCNKMIDKFYALIPIVREKISDGLPIIGGMTLTVSFLPPIYSMMQAAILAIIGAIFSILTKIVYERLFKAKKAKPHKNKL